MGGWRFRVGALVVILVSGSCAAVVPTPGPAAGTPGAPGPCGVSRTDLVNPVDARHPVSVLEPTGDGEPWTGGRCDDDRRPVAFVAHGYVGNFVEGYEGMVEHLVSNGFVVVFPGYTVDFDPPHQYRVVDAGFVLGAGHSKRVDLDRIGVIGHSFGAGMAPWLLQQASRRGWGGEATWLVDFAPWYAQQVGTEGIVLPSHTQATIVSYEFDYFVDTRIAIELHRSLLLPASQRRHVVVRSDQRAEPVLEADHLGPVSVELVQGFGTISTDHLDRWVTYRSIDATAGCSLSQRWCDHDFTDTGARADGKPVTRALVAQLPQEQPDIGPPALQECDFFLNPRRCP